LHAAKQRAGRCQVLPVLAPFLGRGRVGNFLVRNKWRNYEAIKRCRHLPMLLLSSLQVRLRTRQPVARLHVKTCVCVCV